MSHLKISMGNDSTMNQGVIHATNTKGQVQFGRIKTPLSSTEYVGLVVSMVSMVFIPKFFDVCLGFLHQSFILKTQHEVHDVGGVHVIIFSLPDPTHLVR